MKRYSDSVADNTLLVSQNVTNLMNDIRAEDLLNDAVYYIDARDASASGQTIDNLGTAKELLPTTLGSSTSADSNDPQYLSWSGTNYVYLPGVALNRLTIPDANDLDITGDIDLRVYVAADDWTPSSSQELISKFLSPTNQISYRLRVDPAGNFILQWSTNGATPLVSAVSTISNSIPNGTAKWIRATLDVNNGASGYDVKFFTSDDGTNWTQFGSTVTGVGTTSIFASTTPIEVGSAETGGNTFAGKIYRAQIFNGIDGTKVFDVDTSVLKTGAETSFTALTGQTVTINRSTSGRKIVAVTQPCWLFGTDDYMEVNNRYMSSGTYLYLPGVASNYASTPDAAALDITGDIDLRCKVALDDWTPAAANVLLSKATAASSQFSYQFLIPTNGQLQTFMSLDGTNLITAISGVATPFTDGQTGWVRVTRESATGDVKFYTSTDGTNWTQLGTTQSTAAGNLFAGTAVLEVGSRYDGTNSPARGKFFRAQVFNGIDGTKVFDADFENKITSLEQASFVERSTNAATVTINRSGSTYRSAGITTAGYLYPGSTSTFAVSATDFLNFGAADSFTMLGIVRVFTNAGSGNRAIFAKQVSAAIEPGYALANNSRATVSIIRATTTTVSASTGVAVADGALTVSIGVVNRSTNLLTSYMNNVIPSSTSISTVTESLNNLLRTFIIGRYSNDTYSDIEFYGAAVFRRALTSAEITLITNYFNRRSL